MAGCSPIPDQLQRITEYTVYLSVLKCILKKGVHHEGAGLQKNHDRETRPRSLGRHVEHDPQSRAFSAGTAVVKTVTYKRHGKPFDQGDLGSCTGNAMVGVCMTEPLWVPGRNLTEDDAVALTGSGEARRYSGRIPAHGHGQVGLGVMKAAVKAKYIVGYARGFGLEQLLGGLSVKPGILGINWYDSSTRLSPMGNARCLAPPRSAAATRSSYSASTSRKSGYGATTLGTHLGGRKRHFLYFVENAETAPR